MFNEEGVHVTLKNRPITNNCFAMSSVVSMKLSFEVTGHFCGFIIIRHGPFRAHLKTSLHSVSSFRRYRFASLQIDDCYMNLSRPTFNRKIFQLLMSPFQISRDVRDRRRCTNKKAKACKHESDSESDSTSLDSDSGSDSGEKRRREATKKHS
ncbi:hypothetical protein YC2023_080128 [Brassica napus]